MLSLIIAVIILLVIILFYYNRESFVVSPEAASVKLYNQGWRVLVSTSCPLCSVQAKILYPGFDFNNTDQYQNYKIFVFNDDIKQPTWVNVKHGLRLVGPFNKQQIESLVDAHLSDDEPRSSSDIVQELYAMGWRLHVDVSNEEGQRQLREIFNPIPDFDASPCPLIIQRSPVDYEFAEEYDTSKVYYPFWTNIFNRTIKKGFMPYEKLVELIDAKPICDSTAL